MARHLEERRPDGGLFGKVVEPRTRPVPGLREMARSLDGDVLSNTVIIFLFGVTGPLIVAVTVARSGGLTEADLNSWIFAGFGIAGLASVVFSAWYRQPIVLLFSLPAAVLVGPAMGHFSFGEIVGAYMATGLIVFALAVTGCVRAAMTAVPLPIVMSMAAGVFLPFVLRVVEGFGDVPVVALATIGAFVAVSSLPRVARAVPPLLAALAAGAATTFGVGDFSPGQPVTLTFAEPVIYTPTFSLEAIAELALPLAIVVLAIGNAPSFAILRNAGFAPPQNAVTAGCGIGSILLGFMGSPPLTNPGIVTGTLNRSGAADRRYLAGILFGLLLFAVGVLSPAIVDVSRAMPTALIGILAGLALFGVLQNALVAAFTGGVPIGALVAFVVTISDVVILDIEAPFWGLVFGCAATWLLERDRRADQPAAPRSP